MTSKFGTLVYIFCISNEHILTSLISVDCKSVVRCIEFWMLYGLQMNDTYISTHNLIQGLLESSRTMSKKKCWLNFILTAVSFKINDPIIFPPFKSTVDVIFLDAVKYRLRFPLDVRQCFRTSSPQFNFQFRNKAKSQQVERMGNDNHDVVSHSLCGF
jgi:hypothetical protein